MIANVSSREAWTALERDGDAALVDVRTVAEWSYVGLPDLAPLGKRVILAAWQEFPQGSPRRPTSTSSAGAAREVWPRRRRRRRRGSRG